MVVLNNVLIIVKFFLKSNGVTIQQTCPSALLAASFIYTGKPGAIPTAPRIDSAGYAPLAHVAISRNAPHFAALSSKQKSISKTGTKSI